MLEELRQEGRTEKVCLYSVGFTPNAFRSLRDTFRTISFSFIYILLVELQKTKFDS